VGKKEESGWRWGGKGRFGERRRGKSGSVDSLVERGGRMLDSTVGGGCGGGGKGGERGAQGGGETRREWCERGRGDWGRGSQVQDSCSGGMGDEGEM